MFANKTMAALFCASSLMALCAGGAEAKLTKSIPLEQRALWRGDADIKTLPDGGPNGGPAVLWTTPTSKEPAIRLSFKDIGVDDLSKYDEIACDFYLEDSDAYLSWQIEEWPRTDELSSWYSKVERPLRQWIEWRCDLRLDDDGVVNTLGFDRNGYKYHPEKHPQSPEFVFTLQPFFLRFQGEPDIRRVRIANLRLIKNPVTISYDKKFGRCEIGKDTVKTIYDVTLENRLDSEGVCIFTLDTSAMFYHRPAVDGVEGAKFEFPLKKGEKKTVKLELAIDRATAERLPGLFAEPVKLSARMKEIPEIVVKPLNSERFDALWAAVPLFNPQYPRAEETVARNKDMIKLYPWIEQLAAADVKKAEALLDKKFDVLTGICSVHQQWYLCPDCGIRPVALDPEHHKCPKCGKVLTDERIVAAYRPHAHGANFAAADTLAQAYQLTGDAKFARKATEILLLYADSYEKIEGFEPRSTCANARVALSTLHECFVIPLAFSAYHKLKESSALSAAEKVRIENDFLLNAACRLMRHNANQNQQAEHFNRVVPGAMFAEKWHIAGEELYGPLGWFNLVKAGFSADGIAHEGGGYHAGQMHSMGEAAELMWEQGVNLFCPAWKRVFDGSVAISPSGVSSYGPWLFELAYRQWRDPAYLPTLKSSRQKPNWTTVNHGVIGLPPSSGTLDSKSELSGAGYLFLRRATPQGHRTLAINYGMQWERSEKDRLHVRMFVDGEPVSRQVGRITYGSPFAASMGRSFAHNLVTIDRKDMLEERLVLDKTIEEDRLSAALFRTDADRPLYPGVSQSRLVAIVGSAFFVADVLQGTEPHLYDWHFFPVSTKQAFSILMKVGEGETPQLLVDGELPKGSTGAWQEGKASSAFTVDYSSEKPAKSDLKLFLVPDGEAEVLDGSIMQFSTPKLHPFTRVTRHGSASALFAALYAPSGTVAASPARIESPKDVFAWTVEVDGARHLLGINNSGKPVTLQGLEFAPGLIAGKLQTK